MCVYVCVCVQNIYCVMLYLTSKGNKTDTMKSDKSDIEFAAKKSVLEHTETGMIKSIH